MNWNGVWKAIGWIRGIKRCAWWGVRGAKGECWWWSRSAERNWGEQFQAKERRWGLRSTYPAEQPIHAEQRQNGWDAKSMEWNWGAPNGVWGGDWGAPILEEERAHKGSMERWMKYRITSPDWGVRILSEEHQWALRSADGAWGTQRGIDQQLLYRRRTLGGGTFVWGSPTICNWWVEWRQE